MHYTIYMYVYIYIYMWASCPSADCEMMSEKTSRKLETSAVENLGETDTNVCCNVYICVYVCIYIYI